MLRRDPKPFTIYQGTIRSQTPFDPVKSAQQPIVAVRTPDKKLYLMNGNHRVMGAVQSGRTQVDIVVYTVEQWEKLYGPFNPTHGTALPSILPGTRPIRPK